MSGLTRLEIGGKARKKAAKTGKNRKSLANSGEKRKEPEKAAKSLVRDQKAVANDPTVSPVDCPPQAEGR